MEGIDAPLADMEAAGVYMAAQMFFSQERMFFFKVVLDHPGGQEKEQVTPGAVREVCGLWIEKIWTFIAGIAGAFCDIGTANENAVANEGKHGG